MTKLKQERKLIINCKPGDPLYMVKYAPSLQTGSIDYISRIFIKEIIPRNEWEGGDLFKCEENCGLYGTTKYEFHNTSSHHDELILDEDFLYCDGKYNGYRCYTSYQGALDWLVGEIQYNIYNQLSRLENISERLGTSERPLLDINTYYLSDGNEKCKKSEIYDLSWVNKDKLSKFKSSSSSQKVEVYRRYVELDAIGRNTSHIHLSEEHFRDFDTPEEANKWIYENDESRWPCQSGKPCYEGYRYYIKHHII